MRLKLNIVKKFSYKNIIPSKICEKNKKSYIKIGHIYTIYNSYIVMLKWNILLVLLKNNTIISKGLLRTLYKVIKNNKERW